MLYIYLNLSTLEGLILRIILDGIQSINKEIIRNIRFKKTTSKIEMYTGAESTKYVEGSNFMIPKYFCEK